MTATASQLSDAPLPVPDADSEGFWQSARDGRLAICRCSQCRKWQHPPLEHCRYCGAPTAFEPVSGRGTVFSFIVVRQQTVPGHEAPYVVALVELAEQPDIRLTAVVQAPPAEVRIGMPVTAVMVPIGDGTYSAPEFVPASG